MSFVRLLTSDTVRIGTIAKNKEDILKEISKLSKNNQLLNDITEEEIFSALKKREKLCSTGFGNFIAIPHCSFEKLTDFVVGILVAPDGVDFNSLDNQKTKIFFYIIFKF